MSTQTQSAQVVSNTNQNPPAAAPTNVPSGHASLYVGDLDEDVTEAMIYDKFCRIGSIVSIRVCRDMISRKSLGYAYVNFSTTAEAEKAIDELNFETLNGRQMRIMWSQRDPSLRKSGVGNLFIKNLDKKILVRELSDTFSTIGDILSCKIPVDEKGNSKGYGFVHFVSKEAADAAVNKLDGSILNDKRIFVGHFVPKSQRSNQGIGEPTFNNLYIKNFGETMTEEKLRDLFKPHGEITSLCVPMQDANTSKGFGFVCYKEPKSAQDAVDAIHNSDFSGRSLHVGRAMKKNERMEFLKGMFEKKKADKSSRYATGVNLYVKNLDDGIDDEQLRKEFAEHGNITSVKVMTDPQNRSKGFGFVCFSYPDQATKAVTEMNGKLLGGKPLYVALAQRKEERKMLLQSQISQRQMVYRGQPNQMHPGMMPNASAGPFANAMNAAGFSANPGAMFMYQNMANQQGQPMMPGGFFPGMAPNRMMQMAPVRQAQATRWVTPGAQNQGPIRGNSGIAGYPGSMIRPNQPMNPAQQRYISPGMPNMRQAGPGAVPPMMNPARMQPPMSAQQPQAAGGVRPGMNQPVQFTQNARNINQPMQNQQMMNSVRPQQPANGNIGGKSVEPDSLDAFINIVKSTPQVDQKQLLGERLYSIITEWYPREVGKLTGMLLEIDNIELITLIMDNSKPANPEGNSLKKKVDAAMKVLSTQANDPAGDSTAN